MKQLLSPSILVMREGGGFMPVITKITRQKRNEHRYNIFIDEAYAFSVDESVLVKHRLTKGMTMDEWLLGDVTYEDEIEKAFQAGVDYLSYRMRSEREVKDKLLAKEFGEAVVLEALAKLRRVQLLDDEAFTKAYVRTQWKSGKKGPRVIRRELTQKGIDPNLQEEVLKMYDDQTQWDIAMELAESTKRSNERHAPAQVKRKIYNRLLRKGFASELIQSVLDEIEIEREQDEWDAILEREGEKAWTRHSRKYSGYDRKMRVKQTLYQKGIPFDKIDEYIEMKENEEDGIFE